MTQLYANNATTTLFSDIGTSDTALTVVSIANFPVIVNIGDYFYATLADARNDTWEIVKVTATSGTNFTVVRAQDNTTANTWASGSVFEMRDVAQILRDVIIGDKAYSVAMSIVMG